MWKIQVANQTKNSSIRIANRLGENDDVKISKQNTISAEGYKPDCYEKVFMIKQKLNGDEITETLMKKNYRSMNI